MIKIYSALFNRRHLNFRNNWSRHALSRSAIRRPAAQCYEAIVVHGTEMQTFIEADWTRVLKHKEIVFARTMPQQKQNIVKELNTRAGMTARRCIERLINCHWVIIVVNRQQNTLMFE
jgi:magnesium-transporting ATPase (P-type)